MANVARIAMEIDKCSGVCWVLLLDEPGVEFDAVFRDNFDIIEWHAIFERAFFILSSGDRWQVENLLL